MQYKNKSKSIKMRQIKAHDFATLISLQSWGSLMVKERPSLDLSLDFETARRPAPEDPWLWTGSYHQIAQLG